MSYTRSEHYPAHTFDTFRLLVELRDGFMIIKIIIIIIIVRISSANEPNDVMCVALLLS